MFSSQKFDTFLFDIQFADLSCKIGSESQHADTNRGRHRLYVELVRLVQQLVRGLECAGLTVRQWRCWWRGQSIVQCVL